MLFLFSHYKARDSKRTKVLNHFLFFLIVIVIVIFLVHTLDVKVVDLSSKWRKLCWEKLLFLGYICQLRNTKGPRVTQLWLRYYKLLYDSLVIFMLLCTTLSPFNLLQSCNLQIDVAFFFPINLKRVCIIGPEILIQSTNLCSIK